MANCPVPLDDLATSWMFAEVWGVGGLVRAVCPGILRLVRRDEPLEVLGAVARRLQLVFRLRVYYPEGGSLLSRLSKRAPRACAVHVKQSWYFCGGREPYVSRGSGPLQELLASVRAASCVVFRNFMHRFQVLFRHELIARSRLIHERA